MAQSLPHRATFKWVPFTLCGLRQSVNSYPEGRSPHPGRNLPPFRQTAVVDRVCTLCYTTATRALHLSRYAGRHDAVLLADRRADQSRPAPRCLSVCGIYDLERCPESQWSPFHACASPDIIIIRHGGRLVAMSLVELTCPFFERFDEQSIPAKRRMSIKNASTALLRMWRQQRTSRFNSSALRWGSRGYMSSSTDSTSQTPP